MDVDGLGRVDKWKVVAFRTDGISATITFVSGCCQSAPNAEKLLEKGYNISAPDFPIDTTTTKRGLFCVQEGRCDIAPTDNLPDICVVDPGFVKPIHAAFLQTGSESIHQATHWSLSEEEWMCESGRKQKQEAEDKRRQGTEYGRVLEEMGKTRGRKSVSSAFVKYCNAMFSSLGILR